MFWIPEVVWPVIFQRSWAKIKGQQAWIIKHPSMSYNLVLLYAIVQVKLCGEMSCLARSALFECFLVSLASLLRLCWRRIYLFTLLPQVLHFHFRAPQTFKFAFSSNYLDPSFTTVNSTSGHVISNESAVVVSASTHNRLLHTLVSVTWGLQAVKTFRLKKA